MFYFSVLGTRVKIKVLLGLQSLHRPQDPSSPWGLSPCGCHHVVSLYTWLSASSSSTNVPITGFQAILYLTWFILISLTSRSWLILFCHLDTNFAILEKGTSVEKTTPLDWPMGKPVVHFLMDATWTVRKQSEQARRDSLPPWPVLNPCFQVPALTTLNDGLRRQNKPLLPKLLWAMMSYHSNRDSN